MADAAIEPGIAASTLAMRMPKAPAPTRRPRSSSA